MSKKFTDINDQELDDLIQRVTDAKEHNLTLSPEDCQLLLDALLTLANVQERLNGKDITILKLKKLVGMVQSSEKLSDSVSRSSGAKDQKKRSKKQSDSTQGNKKKKIQPEVKKHSLDELSKGDQCPECETGQLNKYEPATFLRITGQTPFVPVQHVMERLRCNTCGAYFTAPLPEEVIEDGKSNQKYGFSARSLMGVSKYYMGSPFYRQGSLQDLLGVPITASTIFDQTEYLANDIFPVFKQLILVAANAKHYCIDDTTHRILEQEPILKKQRNSDKKRLRTGIYTSGMIATTTEEQRIILFETNIGHAGEFLDLILKQRDLSNPPPLIMADALSSNEPSKVIAELSRCNSHGRRQFYDVLSHYTDEVEEVLCLYSEIWVNDFETKEQKLSPSNRLEYHKKHSLPIMERVKRWGEVHLEKETVEENSGLGKAIRYFINHYQGLIAFCRLEGALLDNNQMEAQLKLIVRNRKNAMFHKTLTGASIADVITSMIATAGEAGVNVFDYFNWLQRESENVKILPESYLPWNYLENFNDES